jgi:hypothetical protein
LFAIFRGTIENSSDEFKYGYRRGHAVRHPTRRCRYGDGRKPNYTRSPVSVTPIEIQTTFSGSSGFDPTTISSTNVPPASEGTAPPSSEGSELPSDNASVNATTLQQWLITVYSQVIEFFRRCLNQLKICFNIY